MKAVRDNIIYLAENGCAIAESEISSVSYDDFCQLLDYFLQDWRNHCVNYFAVPEKKGFKLYALLALDYQHKFAVLASNIEHKTLQSLSIKQPALTIFEREIHENYGIDFIGNPWLKPLRYSHKRFNPNAQMAEYPFFKIEGEDIHEVGVGPIHAGVIEPGHFRFQCQGENILHLEIQLGYQHRGIESLMLQKSKLIQRTILAESIAGDSVASHTSTFAQVIESLAQISLEPQVLKARVLAQEIERIGYHVGDLSGVCQDIAYQLGSSVFGALRTPIINFMQAWCGNRFTKGLIRVGYNPFLFTQKLAQHLHQLLDEFAFKFHEMAEEFLQLPSALARIQNCGKVSQEQMLMVGAVGMPARTTGLKRDIRQTHPYYSYQEFPYKAITLENGDVYGRVLLRIKEIEKSIKFIKKLIETMTFETEQTAHTPVPAKLTPNSFAFSVQESWRGEVCHIGLTDAEGSLKHYKIKDPSFHNWMALALACRNIEISDFPINNKSFNLSYCGFDL